MLWFVGAPLGAMRRLGSRASPLPPSGVNALACGSALGRDAAVGIASRPATKAKNDE